MKAASIVCGILIFLTSLQVEAAGQTLQATQRLNVRSCPGTGRCGVLFAIPPGTRMDAITRQGEWIQVRVLPAGSVGWVHSRYVSGASSPGQTQTTSAPRVSLTVGHAELSTHIFSLLLILGLIIFNGLRQRGEGRLDSGSVRAPWRDLISHPKIVSSWVVMALGALAGAMIARSSLNANSEQLTVWELLSAMQFLSYAGWAAFWGVPPCMRWWMKIAKQLLIWTPIGCIGIALAAAFVVSILYSYWGGGLIHFFRYWWQTRSSMFASLLMKGHDIREPHATKSPGLT